MSTIKNTLILEEPYAPYQEPSTISNGMEPMRQKHKHGKFVLMKGKDINGYNFVWTTENR